MAGCFYMVTLYVLLQYFGLFATIVVGPQWSTDQFESQTSCFLVLETWFQVSNCRDSVQAVREVQIQRWTLYPFTLLFDTLCVYYLKCDQSQNKVPMCDKDAGAIAMSALRSQGQLTMFCCGCEIYSLRILGTAGSQLMCEFQFPWPCHYLHHHSCLVRRTWGILWILGVGHPRSIYVGALPPLPGLVELVSGISNLRFVSRFFFDCRPSVRDYNRLLSIVHIDIITTRIA